MSSPPYELPMTGRLPHFRHNWTLISPPNNVLDYIEGLTLPLTSEPIPTINQPLSLPKEHIGFIRQEISRLLSINAIQRTQERGFTSPVFLRKKASGQWRLILNLKLLNNCLSPPHFKMEGIQCVQYVITQKDYMTKIDLKDAYLTVAVHMKSRQYLQFEWENTLYQYITMPFGLSIAPFVFTKTLKRPITLLRLWGVRLIVYLDDILIAGPSTETTSLHTNWVIRLLSQLGFVINHKKSILNPTQEIEFLGLLVNTTTMTLKLPASSLANIRSRCKALLRNPRCTVRQLAALVGLLSFSKTAITPAPIFYRSLQLEIIQALHTSTGNYNQMITLGAHARLDLEWWISSSMTWNIAPILRPMIQYSMQTDASLTGWGAVCKDQKASGLWSQEEKSLHINMLELKAIMFGITLFAKANTHVLIQTDSRTAIRYVNKLGGTHSRSLCNLSLQLHKLAMSNKLTLTAEHLPGVENIEADKLSRQPNQDWGDWQLLPTIFKMILQHTGLDPQIDLFASRLNTQLPKFMSWKPDPEAIAVKLTLSNRSLISTLPISIIGGKR